MAKRRTAPESNWRNPTTGQRIEEGTVSSRPAWWVDLSRALVTADLGIVSPEGLEDGRPGGGGNRRRPPRPAPPGPG